MCVVSMIMDHYGDEWDRRVPRRRPWAPTPPIGYPPPYIPPAPSPITQAEVDEFRRLLERAREYDRKNNEPDCELESKRERIRQLAKELGIEVGFIEAD